MSFCYLCGISRHDQLVNSPCNCDNIIHLSCLIEITRISHNKCRICNQSYNRRIDLRGRYFYPTINVYPHLTKGKYYIIDDNSNIQLELAITYLQVNCVNRILETFNKEMMINYLENANYLSVHKISNGRLLIKDVISHSQISRRENSYDFMMIETSLNDIINKYRIRIVNT